MAEISIIVAANGRSDLLGETINSVISQSFSDWELIVVVAEDSSVSDADTSLFTSQDQRIRFVRVEPCGHSVALNSGASVATAGALIFVDCGDIMLPHNLELLANALAKSPEIDVVYGWFYPMNADGSVAQRSNREIDTDVPPQVEHPWEGDTPAPSGAAIEGAILAQLMADLDGGIASGATLVRRQCFEAIGGFDPQMEWHAEWDLYVRLARAGSLFKCCRQAILAGRAPSNATLGVAARNATVRHMIVQRYLDELGNRSGPKPDRELILQNNALRTACEFLWEGRTSQGEEYLRAAFRYNALPDQAGMARLVHALTTGAISLGGDPVAALDSIVNSANLNGIGDAVRRGALLQLDMPILANRYRTGDRIGVLAHGARATLRRPSLLKNKWLQRVVVSSFVGPSILDRRRSRRWPEPEHLLESFSQGRCVFISPHFDDAALSCGGIMSAIARRGGEGVMTTVFTADVDDGAKRSAAAAELHREWGVDKPYAMRAQDDMRVCERLGYSQSLLGFEDATYRDQNLGDISHIFVADFEPRSDPIFAEVCAALSANLHGIHPTAVFAPLGLGAHRDHLIVHAAAQEIRSQTHCQWFFYEDFPYAITADLHTRLAKLSSTDVSSSEAWRPSPVSFCLPDFMGDRIELVSYYTSEALSLFGNEAKMAEAILDYANGIGEPGRPRERFWI